MLEATSGLGSAHSLYSSPMTLPNADRAYVPLEKLTGYSLNPVHRDGKHKARVFRAALGLTVEDAEWLRAQILTAVREARAVEKEATDHGRRYTVEFPVSTEIGAATVLTAWIIRHGETFPRLTSCYVP